MKSAEIADTDDRCSDFLHHKGIMPRLATRPRIGRHPRSSTLLDLLARASRSWTVRSRMSRELIIFGGALLIGLIGVPLAIWFVGNRILGPYTHGTNTHAGPMALLGDFFVGLGHGAISYWVVALGPAVIILLVRIAWAFIPPRPPVPRASVPRPSVKSNRRIEPTVSKDRL
jgi:hypothetical protein